MSASRSFAGVDLARRLQHHRSGRQGLRIAFRQHVLHGLKIGDRMAELDAARRVIASHLDQTIGLTDASRRHVHSCDVDACHRILEPLALNPAEQIGRRNTAIVEEDLCCMRAVIAEFAIPRRHFDTRRV